ncbi:MAG: hypothetical protein KGJ41_08555 [Rhodospirillales bacterium]|nr:hypothetical protein [Rhodospirillales bacterium]MDE2574898.1 hypothetical protein [Rhodospirillales bacterium]
MTAPGNELRGVQRDLRGARDEQIIRVVAMVDAMPVRGAADALIAPLRARLAQLRPCRPLTFARLLFTPLDPLILPAPRWGRGAIGVPRTVVAPFAALLRAAMREEGAAIEARLAGHMADRQDILAEAGAALWPRATALLPGLPPPPDWAAATGLSVGDYAALAGSVGAMLAHAEPIARLAGATAPDGGEIDRLLTAAAEAGVLAMMASLLVARLGGAGQVLEALDELAARPGATAERDAAERACAFLLDGIEAAPLATMPLASAAEELRRTCGLLADLAARAARRPLRQARVDEVRREVDASCRARFTGEIDAGLLARTAGLAAASDADIAGIEAAARDLRRFETTARRLGGAELYDRELRRAAIALHPPAGEDAAGRIDRARLVEILQGPDAARAMLAAP